MTAKPQLSAPAAAGRGMLAAFTQTSAGRAAVRARDAVSERNGMRATSGGFLVLVTVLAAVPLSSQSALPRSSSPAAAAAADLQGDPRRGAAEFAACVNCHGHQAEGGFGPDLAGRDIPWIAFRKALRQPWGIMPAFREQLKSDQSLADIRAYLASLPQATALGEWHWRKAPENAPLGQRLYMNFAGCGQCHEPEGKFPRARLGVAARDVNLEYFKKQIFQHYERWPKGTMPLYTPERLPEPVVAEMYRWLVDELGLRPFITGSMKIGARQGDKTTYTVSIVNTGAKDKGLGAEGVTVFVRVPAGASVVTATGTGYEGTMPLAKLGLEPALRLAPHPHDDSGMVERPAPDLTRDVAAWRLPRIVAGEQIALSLTLAGPPAGAPLFKEFEGSTIYWTSPGRRPAGSPPRLVYRDLRIPDKGDHEPIAPPRMPDAQ
jgi:mono/diheme cytochrome c family protein